MDVIDSGNSWHSQVSKFRGMDATPCSATGRAPPKKVLIEFDPQDVEEFIKIADAIESAFPSVVVDGNEAGEGRKGSFEIQTEDGTSLWSRLGSSGSLSTTSLRNAWKNGPLPGSQYIVDRINRIRISNGAKLASK
jgi:hypothetical protein